MTGRTALSAYERFTRESPPPPWLYRVFRGPVRKALARWFDLRVDGLEHLPASGPYLVAANHHNYLDGIVLGVATPAPIAFLVMPRVWRATPLHPMFHRHIRSIPINLERPDVGALRRALHRLQDGGVVGIFPEGPFSVRGRLLSRSANPAAGPSTGSLAFDRRLWPKGIAGGVARAKALARAGLLSASERDTLVKGLDAVRAEIESGTFPFRPELEDIHTNV